MPQRALRARIGVARSDEIAGWALRLVGVASPNPPLDTRAVAEEAAAIIRAEIPEAELSLHHASDRVPNVVARVRGTGPGRQMVLNGYLDTCPLGDPSFRTRDPAGEIDGSRLYGRGAADMKGGIAASIAAFARHREIWSGEAVPTLAGDEESMGQPDTRWLLDHVPPAKGAP